MNEQWGGLRPVMSPEESLAAARKLYRHAMGRKARKWTWELTSGNRYTWPHGGTFYVNPDRMRWGHRAGEHGLRDIIHLIAHHCHRRLHPGDKPHSIRQLRLEAKLTKFAISRRWHEGTLKAQPKAEALADLGLAPEPTAKPDRVVVRYRRMKARLDKWARELERSKRLYAKAQREVRAYERRHGNRVAVA